MRVQWSPLWLNDGHSCYPNTQCSSGSDPHLNHLEPRHLTPQVPRPPQSTLFVCEIPTSFFDTFAVDMMDRLLRTSDAFDPTITIGHDRCSLLSWCGLLAFSIIVGPTKPAVGELICLAQITGSFLLRRRTPCCNYVHIKICRSHGNPKEVEPAHHSSLPST
jgi:hypothetical protein